MDWTETNVTSTLHLCWAAQAGLYYHYDIQKHFLDKKMFGIFEHKVLKRREPLMRGFDDIFLAPHSRHTGIDDEKIAKDDRLTILAESDIAGSFIVMAEKGKKIFVTGHPEYDRDTLDKEYKRDLSKGMDIEIPYNYYRDDNPENIPLLTWRSHANALYTNWLDYYVYQNTPYEWN
jgi:homoserine O-succinyltransferase